MGFAEDLIIINILFDIFWVESGQAFKIISYETSIVLQMCVNCSEKITHSFLVFDPVEK